MFEKNTILKCSELMFEHLGKYSKTPTQITNSIITFTFVDIVKSFYIKNNRVR